MITKQLSALLIMFFLLSHLFAQNVLVPDYLNFEPDLPYDANIPAPSTFLGYEAGEDFTIYAQVVNYFNRLDELSEKIVVKNYGTTHEGRPLIYAVITSAANHQRLEEIRLTNLKLTDPIKTGLTEAQSLMKTQPIVISMSYNIHGNEPSGTEAAMHIAYRLLAAQDPAT
ncbi:MAG: peptidase M14, partial [Saprospiraceae bacterium]|nr:peptidase M14 [Saprospiraceae bacterium]